MCKEMLLSNESDNDLSPNYINEVNEENIDEINVN